MSGIRSFHESMTLDRGILSMLQSPEQGLSLPGSALAPPGALRGVVEESGAQDVARGDRLLEWATQEVETADMLSPGGFQAALGAAASALVAQTRSSADLAAQPLIRACARLVQDQLQLIKLAEFNRNALVQG